MKHVLWLILVWAFQQMANAADVTVTRPFPENKTVEYSADAMPLTAWFLAHWEALGYQVPRDGDRFVWKQFVVNVDDLTSVQKDDVVIFENDDKEPQLGLVIEVEGMKDKSVVAIMQPIPGGMVIMQPLDKAKILGIGRPIKHGSSKSAFTMPTHPPMAFNMPTHPPSV